MWYRIECNRDGSVSSCEEVSHSVASGRYVHYIEASTKEEAIQVLLSRYEKRRASSVNSKARSRPVYAALGKCLNCGGPVGEGREGKTRCLGCNERSRLNRKGIKKAVSRTPTEKAAQFYAENTRKQIREASKSASVRRRTLVCCLEQFDSGTAGSFRSWLVEEIRAAQVKETAAQARKAARVAQGPDVRN